MPELMGLRLRVKGQGFRDVWGYTGSGVRGLELRLGISSRFGLRLWGS